MPAWVIPALTTLIGGIGVHQQSKQANAARKTAEKGIAAQDRMSEPMLRAMESMLSRAQSYDPSAETDAAVKSASETTQKTLERALTNLNARYRAGGGTPQNSSEFGVRAQGVSNHILENLSQFIAERRGSEFARKQSALQSVIGAPVGQIADGYFRSAQMQNPGNMAPMLEMLIRGIEGFRGGKK
jgi:hypothetical protein